MPGRNPITLDALAMLDAIDRRGSFARAAEELGRATSALSYGVQKLEEQLEITLYRRQGRRSVLTPAGRLLLEEGRRILDSTARLADRAREVATGWETRLRIGVESLLPYPVFFDVLAGFASSHPSIELDVCECVLNGGWEALEQDRIDLLVGAPGPVPQQQGYRAIALGEIDLVPVIGARHRLARAAGDAVALGRVMGELRRIVTHDTSAVGIVRSAGLGEEGRNLYVQNIDQKVQAILAGLGIGHLPRHRARAGLADGSLRELSLAAADTGASGSFLAWRIGNRGKGLRILCDALAAASW